MLCFKGFKQVSHSTNDGTFEVIDQNILLSILEKETWNTVCLQTAVEIAFN